LKDVLELPFGFEITAWLHALEPMNFVRPLPLAPTGRKVLVVGMGPAGYTLPPSDQRRSHRGGIDA